jgi:hypothetical protein
MSAFQALGAPEQLAVESPAGVLVTNKGASKPAAERLANPIVSCDTLGTGSSRAGRSHMPGLGWRRPLTSLVSWSGGKPLPPVPRRRPPRLRRSRGGLQAAAPKDADQAVAQDNT